MTKETYEFITAVFDGYAESSSGKEPENAKALGKAWNEFNKLVAPRTLCVEVSGGICQDVHGLPPGWTYEVADYDDDDADEERTAENDAMIEQAKSLND